MLSAVRLIRKAGRQVLCDAQSADFARVRIPTTPDLRSLAQACDLLLVFGGDGTMLRVARETALERTPVLGINVGSLGFLTATTHEGLAESLARVWAGSFRRETRPLLSASGVSRGKPFDLPVLNDVVLSRSAASRMVELEVTVDDEILTRYRCDGLIVCSPTGSTAYSLAAGGAIVCPGASVLTLTPICPHTLSNRSVIMGGQSVIRIRVVTSRPLTTLSADGQVFVELDTGDVVTVKRSRRALRLIQPTGVSFFKTLRKKLNWNGSNVDPRRS